jgi:hypothetical protein
LRSATEDFGDLVANLLGGETSEGDEADFLLLCTVGVNFPFNIIGHGSGFA